MKKKKKKKRTETGDSYPCQIKISKTLETRLKNILPDLISSNQPAYVKNRYINESGRLIYNVHETASILNKKGFLITVDIEKAFGSVEHSFY